MFTLQSVYPKGLNAKYEGKGTAKSMLELIRQKQNGRATTPNTALGIGPINEILKAGPDMSEFIENKRARIFQSHDIEKTAQSLLELSLREHNVEKTDLHLVKIKTNKLAAVLYHISNSKSEREQKYEELLPVAFMLHDYFNRTFKVRDDKAMDSDKVIIVLPFVADSIDTKNIPALITGGAASILPKCLHEYLPKVYFKFKFGETYANLLMSYNQTAASAKTDRNIRECKCHEQRFRAYHGKGIGHVFTTDFTIFESDTIQEMFEKGVKYRQEFASDFIAKEDEDATWETYILGKLGPWVDKLSQSHGVNEVLLQQFVGKVAKEIQQVIDELKDEGKAERIFKTDQEKDDWGLIDPEDRDAPLTVTGTDKLQDRFSIVCKAYYTHEANKTLNKGKSYERVRSKTDKELAKEIIDFTMENKLVDFEEPGEDENEGGGKKSRGGRHLALAPVDLLFCCKAPQRSSWVQANTRRINRGYNSHIKGSLKSHEVSDSTRR